MKEKQIKKYHYLKDKPKERQFDIYDLSVYYQKNTEHSSRPHNHSFYQIIWFKSKKGKHFIDFEDYSIKENRLFFIAKTKCITLKIARIIKATYYILTNLLY